MAGFLFEDIIFGPVHSRRLRSSLGINLLPLHRKYCSFNCIYCECGWTKPSDGSEPVFPSRGQVAQFLEKRLISLKEAGHAPDSLTYAGNGEPTLHPEFAGIVEDTIALRDRYFPATKVSVLSNASKTGDQGVFNALLKLDNNIQKLDAGSERFFHLVNQPVSDMSLETIVENLRKFNGKVIIQSLFLRGRWNGEEIDNTGAAEVSLWLNHITMIRPSMVMVYPIDRATPARGLEQVSRPELEEIALKVRQAGIRAEIY